MRRTITPDDAATTLGPYSHGTTNGQLVFTAGQIPVTESGTVLADQPIDSQTEQSLINIERVLSSADLGTEHVLKTTVYMTDIDAFPEMNRVYQSFFGDNPPARTAVEVQRLADDADIEIEAVAVNG